MTFTHNKLLTSVAASLLIAAVAGYAWSQQTDDVLRIEQPVSVDYYAANRTVEVLAAIDGDLVAAGQRVVVDGDVTGDVIAAAQDIEIRGAVRDDVRASGQRVHIAGPVTGHIVAAAQTITLDQDVGDWAWLAGQTVTIGGQVGGDLGIAAKTINIDAVVDGDLDATGEELHVGPNATIRGDIRWRSDNDAEISPDAQVDGEIIEEPLPDFADELDDSGGVVFTLGLIIAVSALFLLFSEPMQRSAERIVSRPGVSLILGFVILVSVPILALILLISGVGAWLGLTILGVYFPTLLIGVLTGLFTVGNLFIRRIRPDPSKWQMLAAVAIAVIAIGLLTNVPYVGGLVVFLTLLSGVGAISWITWQALQSDHDDALQ